MTQQSKSISVIILFHQMEHIAFILLSHLSTYSSKLIAFDSLHTIIVFIPFPRHQKAVLHRFS